MSVEWGFLNSEESFLSQQNAIMLNNDHMNTFLLRTKTVHIWKFFNLLHLLNAQ